MMLRVILFVLSIQCVCFAQSDSIKYVTIGEQTWLAENLNVERFLNGDLIKEAKTLDEWLRECENRRPAWCYYDNDPANGAKYGKLYNWYAVVDPRGLAPKGWRVSTNEDWDKLVDFLGGAKKAGYKLKSAEGWAGEQTRNSKQASGFNATPGGQRWVHGFNYLGTSGSWWVVGIGRLANNSKVSVLRASQNEYLTWHAKYQDGFSVRCVKNN